MVEAEWRSLAGVFERLRGEGLIMSMPETAEETGENRYLAFLPGLPAFEGNFCQHGWFYGEVILTPAVACSRLISRLGLDAKDG